MFDIGTISDRDLCETGRRLQQAHDRIEQRGFDILRYTPRRPTGACCYVGSVKVVGGPLKRERGGPRENPRSDVKHALSLLDSFSEYGADHGRYPGWGIERQGFSECRGDPRQQAEVALPVFRRAIREVRSEMERRAL